jgi:ferredoxin
MEPNQASEAQPTNQPPATAPVSDFVRMHVDGTAVKSAPISKGLTTKRKRKPHILAVINECCTGCAGSPACVDYCPVADCMYWVPDADHPPFGRIVVDPMLCIGCKLCTSKGPDGAFLEGCPWDAIDMVPLAEFEAQHGPLPY